MFLAQYKCRAITPVFIGNADPNEVEIRVSSITGLMRFWWRAMNARLASESFDKLLKAEEKLFGGVSSGGRRSSFDCWVEDVQGNMKRAKDLLQRANFSVSNGGGYLFYLQINQNGDQFGYEPGLTFDLTFTSESEIHFRQAIASFWLAVNLGGFGTRSRRGGGAIKAELTKLEGLDDLGIEFKVEGTLAEYLARNYKKAKELITIKTEGHVSDQYSHISEGTTLLVGGGVAKGFNSWNAALNDIGGKMMTARGQGERPIKAPQIVQEKLKDKLKMGKYTVWTLDTKAAFGLPISVRNVGMMNFEDEKENNHRSSPIVISCIEDAEKKYHWTVIHLKGKFMPNKEAKIKVTTDKGQYAKGKFRISPDKEKELRQHPFTKENPVLLNHFVDSLKKDANVIQL